MFVAVFDDGTQAEFDNEYYYGTAWDEARRLFPNKTITKILVVEHS